jgi:RNA polymerase sigma factor (TIGR02999 family)
MKITQLLIKAGNGDTHAYNQLYPLVYEKLRLMARKELNREYSQHTLCKTELVHEAYEKMVDHHSVDFRDRAHFYAIAARSMRQILVDYARKKKAVKRVQIRTRIDPDDVNQPPAEHEEHILALNELLIKLKDLDERVCTVVEYRFFAGLSIEETATIMELSAATVNRDWIKARAWLHQHLNGSS